MVKKDVDEVGQVAPSISAVTVGKGRLRASILVDLTVCVASFLSINFGLSALSLSSLSEALGPQWGYWAAFLAYVPWLVLSGAWVAVIAYFARRGQTIGLATFRLRWHARDPRAARRRVLGEPQFWCAALPAIFFLVTVPLAFAESVVPSIAWHVWHITVYLQIDGRLLTAGVVACALALMVIARAHPARLVVWP